MATRTPKKPMTRKEAMDFLKGFPDPLPCGFCGRVVMAGWCCLDSLRFSKAITYYKFHHMSKDDAPHGPCGMCPNCLASNSLGERQCINGWPFYGVPLSHLMVENIRMKELLKRMLDWENLNNAADGEYWRREIQSAIDDDTYPVHD